MELKAVTGRPTVMMASAVTASVVTSMPNLTQDEFIRDVEEFFKWVSPLDKPRESWLLSLENWAKWQYAQETR